MLIGAVNCVGLLGLTEIGAKPTWETVLLVIDPLPWFMLTGPLVCDDMLLRADAGVKLTRGVDTGD